MVCPVPIRRPAACRRKPFTDRKPLAIYRHSIRPFQYGHLQSHLQTLNLQSPFVHDANFNVTMAVDDTYNAATVIERYHYSPYGEVTYLNPDFSVKGTQESDVGNEYLYTGRRLDPGTGIYHYRHRYYHAQLGRFVNRDPIGYLGGMNLYLFANCAPIHWTDPFGLDPTVHSAEVSASVVMKMLKEYRQFQPDKFGNLQETGARDTTLDFGRADFSLTIKWVEEDDGSKKIIDTMANVKDRTKNPFYRWDTKLETRNSSVVLFDTEDGCDQCAIFTFMGGPEIGHKGTATGEVFKWVGGDVFKYEWNSFKAGLDFEVELIICTNGESSTKVIKRGEEWDGLKEHSAWRTWRGWDSVTRTWQTEKVKKK